MPYYISQQPMNPITRIFAAILTVLALVGAFFFGLIILAVVAGLGLLLWIGIRIRVWWLMRHMPPAQEQRPPGSKYVQQGRTRVSKRRRTLVAGVYAASD